MKPNSIFKQKELLNYLNKWYIDSIHYQKTSDQMVRVCHFYPEQKDALGEIMKLIKDSG